MYHPEAREGAEARARRSARPTNRRQPISGGALELLLDSPSIASKRWMYEQFDSTVQASTVLGPGGDAGVFRVPRHPIRRSRFRSIATAGWSGWTRTRAARRRSRRRRATSPVPAPVRSESPTVSTSAIPKSRRCFISSRRRAAALPKPASPSRRRLPGEMSRSTTRAPAAPSIPRPPSAWWACWKTSRTGSRATSRRRETTSWYSGSPAVRSAASAYWAEIRDFIGGQPATVDLDAELRLQRLLVAAAQGRLLRSAHDCSRAGS